ncbi:TPA: YopX family protein [Streptococcus suis]
MILKFRAYNPATNDWYKPEEVFVSDGNIYLDDDDFDELIQNNDVILMQSTGKVDSTGKVEVFVGDILYYPDQDEVNYGIIEFDEDKLAFVLDNGYEKFIYGDYGMDKVVGNIYQNRDLADYILGGNQ